MKILYVTSNGGIHDYRFLNKLTADFEVLLLHYSARNIIDEIREIKGLKIISKIPLVRSFPYLSEKNHFRKIYEDFKPDITHTGYVWQVGILASHANVHPHLSMVWGSDILIEPDKRWYFKKIVKKVMLQADHIQCDAEFVKKKIIIDYSVSAEKITVFPWGIDLHLFIPTDKFKARKILNLKEDEFIIIFNRSLEKIYGIEYLLKGFKDFAEGKPNVRLLILSTGTLQNKLLNYLSVNNLVNKVTFIGTVKNNKLPMYLGASDVYISTSLSDGTSLSLLEAMAIGKPVIVTDLPSIKEWVNDKNGIIIPTKDPVRILIALETYYNNHQLIDKHGNINLIIASEHFNWDSNYIKLKELYNRIGVN